MSKFEQSFINIVQSGVVKSQGLKKLNQKVIDGVLSLVLQTDNNQDLQILSRFLDDYLWPLFNDNSTDSHVILVAAALQSKLESGQKLEIDDSDKLHYFLVRLVRIFGKDDSSYRIKSLAVNAVTVLILCLENNAVRKVTAPIFSILAWSKLQNLSQLLDTHNLTDNYNKQSARQEKLSQKERIEQSLLVNWIPSLISDVCSNFKTDKPDFLDYAIDVNLILTRLLGQLPTRRFTRTLILQSHFIPMVRSFASEDLFQHSLDHLEFYLKFPINEFTGDIIQSEDIIKINSGSYFKLQSFSFNQLEDVEDLAFANHETLKDEKKITESLNSLDDSELEMIANLFGLSFLTIKLDRNIKVKSIIFNLEIFNDCSQLLNTANSLLSEESLMASLQSSINTLPTLKGQFLSLGDFICRNYLLSRNDIFAAIAHHIGRTVERFEYKKDKTKNKLSGNSKHAIKINSTKFNTHTANSIRSTNSIEVSGEIKVDLLNSSPAAVQEWNALGKDDVLLLLSIGNRQAKSTKESEKLGITSLRTAIIQGKVNNNSGAVGKVCKTFAFKVVLDSKAFAENDDNVENYQNFNLAVKLPPHLSKYYTRLDNVAKIVNNSEDKLVEWLYDSFLGFGDPNSGDLNKITQSVDTVELWAPKNTGEYTQDVSKEFKLKSLESEEPQQKRRKTELSEPNEASKESLPLVLNIDGKEVLLKKMVEEASTKKLNTGQVSALIYSLFEGLVIINGASGTGKKSLIAHIVDGWSKNFNSEKTLIVCKSAAHLKDISKLLSHIGIENRELFNVNDEQAHIQDANFKTEKLRQLLNKVDEFAALLGIDGAFGENVENTRYFYKYYIETPFLKYVETIKNAWSLKAVREGYPFTILPKYDEYTGDSADECFTAMWNHYSSIAKLFNDIEALAPLEFLHSIKDKILYLFTIQAKVIGVTIDELINSTGVIEDAGNCFENIIISEASQLTQFESLFPILLQNTKATKRVVLLGDTETYTPATNFPSLGLKTHLNTSLLKRLEDLGTKLIKLNTQYNKRSEITDILQKSYPNLENHSTSGFDIANAGILNTVQFVSIVGEETQPIPEVYQNITEAEYAIQMYQYLRLLGYPGDSITILTPEEGQHSLLKEVAIRKCGSEGSNDAMNDFKFGSPQIFTVEDFRGRQSDIVIVSIVKSSGWDERQIRSALSSARYGCYKLGSEEALNNIRDSEKDTTLKSIVESTDSHQLQIVVGEMYSGVTRETSDDAESYTMESLEHFSQFVTQMTEKRLAAAQK